MNLTIEQRLVEAKRQLAVLNPDAEVEYSLLHPSFCKTVARALLTTAGIASVIIATGATGFGGAFIVMAGMYGHSYNELVLPTEVTYRCPIPISSIEIKEIETVN
ncbi:MAG: hypothetical protein NTU49_00250, partial [Gammaproteobacteria bacterium]|nr:hypothetical protein [Gammaproteobacteria bacterium]